MKPNIGISDKNLKGITAMLAAVLADAMVLYTKTRKFHWNVNGQSFMELHKLFELLQKGAITQEEYIAQKNKLMGA